MRYKNIIFFSMVATVSCTVMRTLQLLSMTDTKGVLLSAQLQYNRIFLILTTMGLVAVTVFGALTHRCPQKMPTITLPLFLVSVAAGGMTIYNMLLGVDTGNAPEWQCFLMKISGILTGVLLLLYGTQRLTKLQLPPLLFALPVFYWIIRLSWTFTTLNQLSLTVGFVLRLLAECSLLIFSLEFAKQYNQIDAHGNFKKLLASALLSVCCTASYTIPILIGLVLRHANTANENAADVIYLFLMGAFALCFTLTHFSQKNLSVAKRRRHTNVQPHKGDQIDIYVGMR